MSVVSVGTPEWRNGNAVRENARGPVDKAWRNFHAGKNGLSPQPEAVVPQFVRGDGGRLVPADFSRFLVLIPFQPERVTSIGGKPIPRRVIPIERKPIPRKVTFIWGRPIKVIREAGRPKIVQDPLQEGLKKLFEVVRSRESAEATDLYLQESGKQEWFSLFPV
jgi:hypothetical protein